jgi:hypothetical protein
MALWLIHLIVRPAWYCRRRINRVRGSVLYQTPLQTACFVEVQRIEGIYNLARELQGLAGKGKTRVLSGV